MGRGTRSALLSGSLRKQLRVGGGLRGVASFFLRHGRAIVQRATVVGSLVRVRLVVVASVAHAGMQALRSMLLD